jgi:hypothetical protein
MTRFLIALCVSLFWATIALFTLTPAAAVIVFLACFGSVLVMLGLCQAAKMQDPDN